VTGDINMQIYLTRIIGKTINIDATTFHTITIQDIINSEKIVNNNSSYAFGQYTNFAYIFGQFGLTGAALGMLMSTPKGEQRKLAASIIVPAMVVNIITGTSEPIEFTFLFLAPGLYFGFHAVMAGIGGMITTVFIY
jgi:PTS system glucose-specific IIC component